MKVYRDGIEIYEIKDYKQIGRFMEIATIECSIKSPTPIDFKIGDYVVSDYNGLTFSLYEIYPQKKQARSGTYKEAFSCDLKFKADTQQLDVCPFLDLVPNDNNLVYTSLPSWSTYENVYGIAARIQANMDYLYPDKWVIKVAETDDVELGETLNEAREFSISGESCFEGLKKIYDNWAVGYIHTFEDGKNVITIGKSAGTTSVFRYGKGLGLKAVKKNIQNTDQLCTRAMVYGSTRNIPARWYNTKGYIGESQYAPNLMIPPSKWVDGKPQGAYIDAVFNGEDRIGKYGLHIKTLSYDGSDSTKDEIFPSVEKVTAKNIRDAKSEIGETDNIPSTTLYPDDTRMDEVLVGSDIEDNGIAQDEGYVLYSDKIVKEVAEYNETITIGEEVSETKYTLLYPQRTIQLATFDITQPANYRVSEILDFVSIKKNDYESTVIVGVYLRRPSGDYIKLTEKSFTNLDEGLRLDENTYALDEVGIYTLEVRVSVNWAEDADKSVVPQVGEDLYLTIGIPVCDVTLARGKNIVPSSFTIKIGQIGFNIGDMSASNGSSKTIHFKSGMCAGRSFGIMSCKYSEDDDSWVLTCKRINDSSVSLTYPNNIFQIEQGDRFVLLNIVMPDLYVYTAMQRLYDTALSDLKYLSVPQWLIEPEIDNIQLARSPQTLAEGMYMPIEEEDLDFADEVLIDSVTITNKGNDLPKYEVTLRNGKIYNRFNKIASRITEIENALKDVESTTTITDAEDNNSATEIIQDNLNEAQLQQYLENKGYISQSELYESGTKIIKKDLLPSLNASKGVTIDKSSLTIGLKVNSTTFGFNNDDELELLVVDGGII